jgi:hypothetical protein
VGFFAGKEDFPANALASAEAGYGIAQRGGSEDVVVLA